MPSAKQLVRLRPERNRPRSRTGRREPSSGSEEPTSLQDQPAIDNLRRPSARRQDAPSAGRLLTEYAARPPSMPECPAGRSVICAARRADVRTDNAPTILPSDAEPMRPIVSHPVPRTVSSGAPGRTGFGVIKSSASTGAGRSKDDLPPPTRLMATALKVMTPSVQDGFFTCPVGKRSARVRSRKVSTAQGCGSAGRWPARRPATRTYLDLE